MDTISFFLFQLAVLLFSVIVHEVSHGLMALRLGDETAKILGRLTLNPIKHLDFVGSFLVPFLLVISNSPVVLGWAKPVPYNPNALYKDYKYGPLKVALAGPASNFAVAIIVGFIVRFAAPFLGATVVALLSFVVFLNVLLAVFNLIPVPPLDGSKILTAFLPQEYAYRFERVGLGGILLVLLFLFFFFGVIVNITQFLSGLILGSSGSIFF